MLARKLATTRSCIDLTERNIGSITVPHAAGGSWAFRTSGVLIEHISYQNAESVSGHISPVIGLGMTSRGTGGSFVGGGGGFIQSHNREWCRFVGRRADGRTLSSDGACDLALCEGAPLLISYVTIGGNEREFILYNPESEISQMKVSVDSLVSLHPLRKRIYMIIPALWAMSYGGLWAILGLILAAPAAREVWDWWSSRRRYKATKEQLEQGFAIVVTDIRDRLEARQV